MRSLDRLLRPRSVAVFGGKEARRVIEQCDRMGFSGAIWPVHPVLEEVLGRRCHCGVAELPASPDAAFVGVNRLRSVEIVRDLAARDAGGAVCYASGFREAVGELADGGALQDALVAAAGEMPIVGPNCYGFINALDGALLWPDQHGAVRVPGGVAVLTQSSNIALNISMQARGLPIAYLMTAGNQAQTGLSDLAGAVLDDPRVTAVGMHIEGFGDIAAFERLALRARALRKPIVVLKTGRSSAARAAAVSHTASIAGDDAVASAVLERLGIARVRSLPALIETLKLLHVHGPLSGFGIASLSCSGGEASLMADAAFGSRIVFPRLPPPQARVLRGVLGSMVSLSNPIDYHTFVWGDVAAQTRAFATVMEGGYALTLVVLDFPRSDRCDDTDWAVTVEAVIAASARAGAPAAIVATLGETMPEAWAVRLMSARIVPLSGIDEAIAAAEAAAAIGAAWAAPTPAPLLRTAALGGPLVTPDEAVAKAELSARGVPVPRGGAVGTPAEAAALANRLGFPVALKALGVAHKTESGAVRLALNDAAAVAGAAADMAGVARGFLVEAMVEPAVAELIAGAVRDPVVGLILTVGSGGMLVEILDDSAVLTLPTSHAAVAAALGRLRVAKLLAGYRGGPRGDIEALVDVLLRVADYVVAEAAYLEELDINPLMVLPRGVVAADALIRRRSAA